MCEYLQPTVSQMARTGRKWIQPMLRFRHQPQRCTGRPRRQVCASCTARMMESYFASIATTFTSTTSPQRQHNMDTEQKDTMYNSKPPGWQWQQHLPLASRCQARPAPPPKDTQAQALQKWAVLDLGNHPNRKFMRVQDTSNIFIYDPRDVMVLPMWDVTTRQYYNRT